MGALGALKSALGLEGVNLFLVPHAGPGSLGREGGGEAKGGGITSSPTRAMRVRDLAGNDQPKFLQEKAGKWRCRLMGKTWAPICCAAGPLRLRGLTQGDAWEGKHGKV